MKLKLQKEKQHIFFNNLPEAEKGLYSLNDFFDNKQESTANATFGSFRVGRNK